MLTLAGIISVDFIAIDAVTDSDNQVILALIALIGTSIAALVYTIRNNVIARQIAVDASEANKAVNNVGPGEHRLYEVISRIESKQDAFDKAWGNLPAEMANAVALVDLVRGIRRDVAEIQVELKGHIDWEQSVKWPAISHEHNQEEPPT